MNIGEMVDHLHIGNKVARAGWNGKGMYLFLKESDGAEVEYYLQQGEEIMHAVEQPWVAMFTANGSVVPWLCSQSDLLANDWEVVP